MTLKSATIAMLSDIAIRSFSIAVLSILTKDQVHAITPTSFEGLSRHGLRYFSPVGFEGISADQIKSLGEYCFIQQCAPFGGISCEAVVELNTNAFEEMLKYLNAALSDAYRKCRNEPTPPGPPPPHPGPNPPKPPNASPKISPKLEKISSTVIPAPPNPPPALLPKPA